MKVTIDTEDIDVLRRAVGLDAEECLSIIRRAAVELLSIGEAAFWAIPDMEEWSAGHCDRRRRQACVWHSGSYYADQTAPKARIFPKISAMEAFP